MKANKKNRFLCLLLALMTAVGATLGLASCGNGDTPAESDTSKKPDQQTEETTQKQSAIDTLEIVDYGGKDYRIISTNQDERQVDFLEKGQDGTTLNDLVYNRNRKVEALYNVKIVAAGEDYSKITDLVKKASTGGLYDYDLYVSNMTAYPQATGGYLMDMRQMPYVDLTQEWWDQAAVADLTINEMTHMIIGDISPTELLTSECILFNKDLFKDKGIEEPYDVAFNGEWTLSYMNEICKNLTTDMDGDGKYTKFVDVFCFTGWDDCASALFYGAGGDISHFDADNGELILDFDIAKNDEILTQIRQLIVGNHGNYETSVHEDAFKVFNNGQAYFCDITFQKISMFLSGMEDKYGVLPMPKLTAAQEKYQTCVSGAGSMVIAPRNMSDDDANYSGMLMEAMAAVSYDMITPDLIDVLASTKNVCDGESSQMVQLIIRNRNFDTARSYGIGADEFASTLIKSTGGVSSWYSGRSKSFTSLVKKLNAAYFDTLPNN